MATEQELREPSERGAPAAGGSPAAGGAAPAPEATIDLRARKLAFAAILLSVLLAALDQSIVATALPRIVGDLGGFNELSWVVTAYLLASTVTIPLYGKLSDLYGRRRLFVVAITIFLVGSALCGIAQSMGELIAFRALQGLGAGGLVPLSQAAVGDLFSARERGKYQGYIASMWGIAAVSGPLVGGTLTQAISWRWIFYVNVPLGLIALLVVVKTLSATKSRDHKIDYGGAFTLGASLAAILIACAWSGTTYPIASLEVVGPFVAGLVGLCAFVLIERRASEPIIPPVLLRNRIFLTAVGAYFVVGAVLFSVSIYLPVYLQDVRGNTPTISGVTMISFTGCWVVTAIITGRLIVRTGHYKIFPLIGSFCIAGGLALLLLITQTTPRFEICLMLALGGIGMGMTASPYIVGVQNSISPTMYGSSSASMSLFRAIGGSLSVSVLGAVLASRARSVLAHELGARARTVNLNRLINGSGLGAAHRTPDVMHAVLSGLHSVHLVAVFVALAGICFAIALEERPLSTKVGR